MRISTLIRIGMAVTALFLVAILVVLFGGFGRVQQQVEQNNRIAGTLDEMFELSVLTTDYLTFGEERAVRQWRLRHDALGERIEEVRAHGAPDEELVTRISENHERVGGLFAELVDAGERIESVGPGAGPLEEHTERLVARLIIVSQEMVADTIALSEITSDRVIGATWSAFLVLALVVTIAAGTWFSFSFWADQVLVSPLAKVGDVARRVGSGDLEQRTGLADAPGELGDLARAFDAMIEDVQSSYHVLRHEVLERRQAEAKLEEYRDQLEVMVEERTRELTEALEQLEAASLAKDRFLASMTHELRTPLNSIIGFAGVILGGLAGPVSDEQRRQLEMVKRSGEHLLALINDLLDLSRIEAGRIDIRLSEFDPGALCEATASLLGPLADAKGLLLRCIVDAGAPRSVSGDRTKVEQILMNLIENAVKFTDSGEVVVRVSRHGRDGFAVSVADTGPGIAATDLPYIFERFHRARVESVVSVEGTGLGLEISRSLAEALGGSLTVRSEVGEGSVFTLTLPVRYTPG